MSNAQMEYKSNRSFSRGLAVLEALNRHGSATAQALARESGIPRPTVYRLLQTLQDAGYVGRGLDDDRFHLRRSVRQLSGGFKDAHWISSIAMPKLVGLTQRISWPCDIATLEGLTMAVQDTTHPISPLSIDYNMAGRHLPILLTSMGIAYLSFTSPTERTLLIDMLAHSAQPHDVLAREPEQVKHLITATLQRGYALRHGGSIWPHSSSIAVPIRLERRVLGTIAVIWMARIMSLQEGIRRYLKPMQESQALIEQSLRSEQ